MTEDKITSMFAVVYKFNSNSVDCLFYMLVTNVPCREDNAMFDTTIENLSSDKKLQKVSVQYLHIDIAAF